MLGPVLNVFSFGLFVTCLPLHLLVSLLSGRSGVCVDCVSMSV